MSAMKRAMAAIAAVVYSSPEKARDSGDQLHDSPSLFHQNEKKHKKRKSANAGGAVLYPATSSALCEREKKRKIGIPRNGHLKRTITPELVNSMQSEAICYPLNSLSSKLGTPLNKSDSIDRKLGCYVTKKLPEGINKSKLMSMIPHEVLSHCLLFLPLSDRSSIVCVCKDIKKVCNSAVFLKSLKLGGEPISGHGGFIRECDTRESAIKRLTPLFKAGNLEACHMIGIIYAYCYDDVKTGIRFLSTASNNGCIRSAYSLGLILRDSCKKESVEQLVRCASKGYLPALQELLPAKDMKEKYGEPSAEELGAYFDSVGLGRLLRRNYSQYPRNHNASHCWNPYCGRWAYKSEKTKGPTTVSTEINPQSSPKESRTTQLNSSLSTTSLSMVSPSTAMDNANVGNTNQFQRCVHLQGHLRLQELSLDTNRLSRMKMCSSCRRAKYCSKLCQVYDWRSGRHKKECRRI